MRSLSTQPDQLVGQSRGIGNGLDQAGSGGHVIRSTYWHGPVGFLECSCSAVTEVYEGGLSDCRFARLEDEMSARQRALNAEFAGRLATAKQAAANDEREWRRVQRSKRRATA